MNSRWFTTFTFISLNDCSLHLTNSVGHNVKEEKKAAITPAVALLSDVSSSIESFFCAFAIIFWHAPYPMESKWYFIVVYHAVVDHNNHLPAKRMEFSATFAIIAGNVPAYNPRMKPSLRNVSSKQLLIPLYIDGNVCIFTLTVSNGWLTITRAHPPDWKYKNKKSVANTNGMFEVWTEKITRDPNEGIIRLITREMTHRKIWKFSHRHEHRGHEYQDEFLNILIELNVLPNEPAVKSITPDLKWSHFSIVPTFVEIVVVVVTLASIISNHVFCCILLPASNVSFRLRIFAVINWSCVAVVYGVFRFYI